MQHAVNPLELFAAALTNPALQMACLTIILVACVLAVFSTVFEDTLTQRAAFMVVALAASAQLGALLRGHAEMSSAGGALLVGLAIYCSGTVLKLSRLWYRRGKPNHPLRRSTDSMPLEPMSPNTGPLSTSWQDTLREDRRGNRPTP